MSLITKETWYLAQYVLQGIKSIFENSFLKEAWFKNTVIKIVFSFKRLKLNVKNIFNCL